MYFHERHTFSAVNLLFVPTHARQNGGSNQISTDPGELSNSYETMETISKYRKNTIKEKRIMRNARRRQRH